MNISEEQRGTAQWSTTWFSLHNTTPLTMRVATQFCWFAIELEVPGCRDSRQELVISGINDKGAQL